MLKLTRITGETIYINPETISYMEDCGDTVLWIGGRSMRVRENPARVYELFMQYKMAITRPIPQGVQPSGPSHGGEVMEALETN